MTAPEPWPFPRRPQPPVPQPPREPGPPAAPQPSGLALELADRLLDRRIILLSGPLDREAAAEAVARLMLLDADSVEPVELRLSCPDGDLDAALVLAEAVDLLRAPVTAVLLGTVGGPTLAVVAASRHVVAHPTATLVLREPTASASGRADELAAAAERHARQVEQLCARLAARGGRSPADVAADLRVGRVLDARQALDEGLVDEIAAPRH